MVLSNMRGRLRRSITLLPTLATLAGAPAGPVAVAQSAPASPNAPGIDWLEVKPVTDAFEAHDLAPAERDLVDAGDVERPHHAI